MVAVFGIFATLSLLEFKEMGVGLAMAVLIDATIVRGVLLPATMKLLGDWNWYLPSWLEWLPRIAPTGSRAAVRRAGRPPRRASEPPTGEEPRPEPAVRLSGGARLGPRCPGLLSIERRDEVALVTLQRPEKRNALSIDLRVELADAFGAWARTRGRLHRPHRGRHRLLRRHGHERVRRRRRAQAAAGRDLDGAFEAVGSCPRPVVAAVNGPALAGGFALALLCDIRIAAEPASFGFPELPRGIPPSYAARAGGRWPAASAAEVSLSGRTFGRRGGAALGVVNEVVADGEALERSLELAAGHRRGAALGDPRDQAQDPARPRADLRPLFAEEARVFREALLGSEPDDAA